MNYKHKIVNRIETFGSNQVFIANDFLILQDTKLFVVH